MISFDAAHEAVHYPEDRRFRIWISARTLLLIAAIVAAPLGLAWMQHAIFGLPYIAPSADSAEGTPSGPHGFLFWVCWSHFSNLFFLFMLIRSGLSILMDHPRLYWNDHCTPGTEWIRSRRSVCQQTAYGPRRRR
jgi:methionine sulfoxide reductase catalytic subunit